MAEATLEEEKALKAEKKADVRAMHEAKAANDLEAAEKARKEAELAA